MCGAPSKNENNEIYSAADASASNPDSAASIDDINNGKKRESKREELEEEHGGENVDALRKELNSVREELRKAKESSEASLNKLKYLMADFDNYRKQLEKQAASKTESIKAELLLKFLNIRDDLLRALSVAKKSKTEPVVIEGLEGILRNIDSQMSETSANSDPACDHRCVAEKLYHRQSKVFQLTETVSFPDLSYPVVCKPDLRQPQR